MVDPGRLERHALVGPAHRPVDLPGQLPGDRRDRRGPDPRAAGADVGDLGGLVVEGGDRGVVTAAYGAVRPERVVHRGLRVVVIRLGSALGLVPGQHRADVGPAPHRGHDLLGVGPGGVHLGLADLGDHDAEPGQRLAQRLLEVLGPARVPAARVGHRAQRPADVLGEGVRETLRDPAQPVVVVPGQDVAAGRALLADLVRDQVRDHQFAQVPQVHRPRRADPGRAGRSQAGMPAFCFGAHPVGRAHYPVIGRSHGTGHLHRLPQASAYKQLPAVAPWWTPALAIAAAGFGSTAPGLNAPCGSRREGVVTQRGELKGGASAKLRCGPVPVATVLIRLKLKLAGRPPHAA